MTRSEEEMIKFMYGLNAIWSICGRDVIAAFDLSAFTVIYDLGGKCHKNFELFSLVSYGYILHLFFDLCE